MLEGETYAIEVFPTTGSGESYEVKDEVPTHLALTDSVLHNLKHAPSDYIARLINIVTTRRCVPFHPEWYNLDDRLIQGGVKDTIWKSYPTIKTRDESLVV